MCEGWSLELGNAFRGAVVRQDHFEQPATWLASVNAADETSIPRLVVASSRKEVRQASGPHHDPGFPDPLFRRTQAVDQRAMRRVF
jgi:hypothetical protein